MKRRREEEKKSRTKKRRRASSSVGSSSVGSSSVASSSGKMPRVRKDKNWPLEKDIVLLNEIRKVIVRTEECFDLWWDDEEVWEKIQRKVNHDSQHVHTIDDVKGRVRSYRKCYKKHGEDAFGDNLKWLVKFAFTKPLLNAPVIVPPSRSTDGASIVHGGATSARGGASTTPGGGEPCKYKTLICELKQLRQMITYDEYIWAVDRFANEPWLTIFFELSPEDRVAYIRRYADEVSSVPPTPDDN